MRIKDAFNYTLDYLKRNFVNALILTIFFGLIVAAVQLLGLVFSLLPLLITLLFLLPLFFSNIVLFHTINSGERLTVKNILTYFRYYFRKPFSGSFRTISALLKTLIFSFIVEIFFLLVFFIIFKAIDPNFTNSINELTNIYTSDYSSGEFYDYFKNNQSIQNLLFYSTTIPSILSTLFFFYLISTQGSSCLFALSSEAKHSYLSNIVFRNMMRSNKKIVMKYYWGLNWPMFVLALIGGAFGVFYSYINYGADVVYSSAIGRSGAFIGIALYLPFYFANNETIHMLLKPYYFDKMKETIKLYNSMFSSDVFSNHNDSDE